MSIGRRWSDQALQGQCAVEAAKSTAREIGLDTYGAVVLYNYECIAVRLVPYDVLGRVAPQAWKGGLRFEAEIAHRLTEISSTIGELEPRAGSRVYVRNTFALTMRTHFAE